MVTRVEKQTITTSDSTEVDIVVGYGVVNIASYNAPVPPATTGTTTYTTEEVVVDVEIDYSSFYERIATALETIATQTTTVAAQTTIIAEKQTAMETYQKKLKELGEDNGIRIIGPYDIFGLVSIYRLLIEQAKILESTEAPATPAQIAAALAEVTRISQLIKSNIPKDF